MRWYIINLIMSIDQTINAMLGGAHDETISSRAGKALLAGKKWAKLLCWFLDKLDPNHCIDAIELDEGRPLTKDEMIKLRKLRNTRHRKR